MSLPAMIRKFHDAKAEGREDVVDLGHRHAAARVPARRRSRQCVCVPDAALRRAEHINVGTGEDLSIRELAEIVRGYRASVGAQSCSTRRNRTARRASCWTSDGCTSSDGGTASELADGLSSTYQWFLASKLSATVEVSA